VAAEAGEVPLISCDEHELVLNRLSGNPEIVVGNHGALAPQPVLQGCVSVGGFGIYRQQWEGSDQSHQPLSIGGTRL
jgi:hypothetical protein